MSKERFWGGEAEGVNTLLTDGERTQLDAYFGITYPGKNRILDCAMLSLRADREMLPEDMPYTVTYLGKILHLWIQSEPCRFSESGKCTVCNYWKGHHTPGAIRAIRETEGIMSGHDIDTILINTCGSVLDERELPWKELLELVEWIGTLALNNVIFETHVSTITDSKLETLRQLLPGKRIFYEVGVESLNQDVMFYCLNKQDVAGMLSRTLPKVHEAGAELIANVLFGIPFLSVQESMEDARHSIEGLLDMGVDYITVFPVNVKPHTIASYLYGQKLYNVVKIIDLVKILAQLPIDTLGRIDVSWFGERAEEGTVLPECPESSRNEVIARMEKYNGTQDCGERKSFLDETAGILKHSQEDAVSLEETSEWLKKADFYQRVQFFYQQIAKDILEGGLRDGAHT